MRYHLSWLTDRFESGKSLNYIFFWGHANKHERVAGEFMLSQWYPSPFYVDEILYKTAAHWMMARKAVLFGDRAAFTKIINADRPDEVRALSRSITGFDEGLWREWKYEIVKEGNFHKFNQNKRLKAYLLSTTDHILVETNPLDRIWGIGLSSDFKHVQNPYTWKGLNLLGFALMEIRDYLNHISEFNFRHDNNEIASHNAGPAAKIIV
jgi:ribA/ribD-fused uncharacterized protein